MKAKPFAVLPGSGMSIEVTLKRGDKVRIQRTCIVVLFVWNWGQGETVNFIPYSQKYWRALNLAVEPKIAIARILADLNLAVWYGILIWQL